MGKSVGNVVTPADLLAEYGADAIRYWAGRARLGVDTTFDLAQIRIGRRLAVKILNASRFVLGLGPAGAPDPAAGAPAGVSPGSTAPLDRALLFRLAEVTEQCTAALAGYDHALALELAERCFWLFCDDYLELVKPRAYGEHGPAAAGSAVATLRLALSVLVRLLAPVLPFVTEEVWSWWQYDEAAGAGPVPSGSGSIHRAAWPDAAALRAVAGPDDLALDAACAAIAAVRKAKSERRLPMRAPVRLLTASGPAAQLDALAAVLADVLSAGRVAAAELRPSDGAAFFSTGLDSTGLDSTGIAYELAF